MQGKKALPVGPAVSRPFAPVPLRQLNPNDLRPPHDTGEKGKGNTTTTSSSMVRPLGSGLATIVVVGGHIHAVSPLLEISYLGIHDLGFSSLQAMASTSSRPYPLPPPPPAASSDAMGLTGKRRRPSPPRDDEILGHGMPRYWSECCR